MGECAGQAPCIGCIRYKSLRCSVRHELCSAGRDKERRCRSLTRRNGLIEDWGVVRPNPKNEVGRPQRASGEPVCERTIGSLELRACTVRLEFRETCKGTEK